MFKIRCFNLCVWIALWNFLESLLAQCDQCLRNWGGLQGSFGSQFDYEVEVKIHRLLSQATFLKRKYGGEAAGSVQTVQMLGTTVAPFSFSGHKSGTMLILVRAGGVLMYVCCFVRARVRVRVRVCVCHSQSPARHKHRHIHKLGI